MIKIGLIGAGHLGKFHIENILKIKDLNLVGIYDSNPENAKEMMNKYSVNIYSSMDELINEVDAIDIVTPTPFHYEIAKKCLQLGKHLFIEKPVTTTIYEAEDLLNILADKNLIVQVGHVERFNPAFKSVVEFIKNPKFIEAHRLSEFKPRGVDVSVILDLMIHDIDLVLSMVKSEVENVYASGVQVISNEIDIVNARIEFINGTVANLTASRVSIKNERKVRIFSENKYMSLDLQKKESNVFELYELEDSDPTTSEMVFRINENSKRKEVKYFQPKVTETNAIEEELKCFVDSILNNKPSVVSLQDGYKALRLAHQIQEKCLQNIEKASKY